MTLLTGLTAQGVEVPVRVDSEGRLVAKASPLAELPPGGIPGQILGKTGPDDYEAGWVDEAEPATALRVFGARSPNMLFQPAGTVGIPVLFESGYKLLNGATFDAATGRFTPTVPGCWLITASVRVGSSATAARLRMRFNTSDVGSNTKNIAAGETPAHLPLHYFGQFNGTTDSVLLEVMHGNAGACGMDQYQIAGIHFPAP